MLLKASYIIIFLVNLLFILPIKSASAKSLTPSVIPDTIVFISDTQSPMWIETLFRPRNNNDLAREMIFNDILRLKPGAVFHLGDLVSRGYSTGQWSAVDTFTSRMKILHIPFFPIPGNHEYFLFASKGISNFRQRFPAAVLTGYSQRINSLAVIMLNSIFSKMSDSEIKIQQSWYLQTMDEFSLDTTISHIIVGCHHSPFTNSRIVNPDKQVQKMFLPEFLHSEKGRVFISGHAHAFEHFRQENKDFIVCGGGGGLQHPLLSGVKQRWPDIYARGNLRKFHYLLLIINEDTIRIILQTLNTSFTEFDYDYCVTITR
jgi:3',5'-cyclic AMP phosphodiesterase CpdA